MSQGRLPTETSDSEMASDIEPVKPAIQMQLKNTRVDEGSPVKLDCIITGQPEPEVRVICLQTLHFSFNYFVFLFLNSILKLN